MKPGAFAVNHPIFRPLWTRVAATAVCLFFAIFDTAGGRAFWAVLFWIITAYLIYQFFVVFDPADYEPKDDDP